MMFISKYRAKTFRDIEGIDPTSSLIAEQVKRGTFPSLSILTGPPGCSKTTHGYIIAKRILCENPSGENPCDICSTCSNINETLYQFGTTARGIPIHKFDLDSNNSDEYVESITQTIKSMPLAKYGKKIIILEELHVLEEDQQKKLQTVMENIPEGVYVIICAAELYKIIPPLRDRASTYHLTPAKREFIEKKLLWVAEVEGINISKKNVSLIARHSTSMRQALVQLERYNSAPNTAMEVFLHENTIDTDQYVRYIESTRLGVSYVIDFLTTVENKIKFMQGLQEFFKMYLKVSRGFTEGSPKATIKTMKSVLGLYPTGTLIGAMELILKMGYVDHSKAESYLLVIAYKLDNSLCKGANKRDAEVYIRNSTVEDADALNQAEIKAMINPVVYSAVPNPDTTYGISSEVLNSLEFGDDSENVFNQEGEDDEDNRTETEKEFDENFPGITEALNDNIFDDNGNEEFDEDDGENGKSDFD